MRKGVSVLSLLTMTAVLLATNVSLQAQCSKFTDYPAEKGGEGEAKKVHVLYRDLVKAEKYAEALPRWEEMEKYCFGAIEWHALDGVKIFEYLAEKETDAAKKKEYQEKVISLYDRYVECFGKTNDKKGDLFRKKANYMFYTAKSDYKAIYDNFAQATQLSGNGLSASAYSPYVYVAVDLFKKGTLTPDDMRTLFFKLEEIANYNIANGKTDKDKERFKEALENLRNQYEPVKYEIFDCNYFIAQFKPVFFQNYNNVDFLENTMLYNLKDANCNQDDAFVTKVVNRIKTIKDSVRVANMSNEDWGDKYYRESDYDQAITFYLRAIETDPMSEAGKAKLAMRISKVYAVRKSWAKAVDYAEMALRYNPNDGEAYLQIGDAYMAGSTECGSNFDRQTVAWVALDMYAKAKSVDSGVIEKANERIGKYSAYMPLKSELFSRTIAEGSSYRVGCWINRTTTVRGRSE